LEAEEPQRSLQRQVMTVRPVLDRVSRFADLLLEDRGRVMFPSMLCGDSEKSIPQGLKAS
jgi:hypothetical protein